MKRNHYVDFSHGTYVEAAAGSTRPTARKEAASFYSGSLTAAEAQACMNLIRAFLNLSRESKALATAIIQHTAVRIREKK